MAIISYVASAQGSGFSAIFGTAPASGDLLIATGINNGDPPSSATGWTTIDSLNSSEDGISCWKICGAGESTTQTPITTVSSNVAILQFNSTTGWPANPIHVHNVKQSTSNNPPKVVLTSIVTITDPTNAALLFAMDGTNSDTAPATVTGYTTALSLSGGTTGNGIACYAIYHATGGLTATINWTGSVASVSCAFIVVIAANPLPLSITDTLSSVSESYTLNSVLSRTNSDTIGSVADSFTNSTGFVRNTSDTLFVPTDTYNTLVAMNRSETDSISAPIDNTSTKVSMLRSISDTFGSISETVAKGASSFIRSVTDSIGAISDTVVKSPMAFVRGVADTVSSITESVNLILYHGSVSLYIVCTDTLSSISDNFTTITSFFRTVTDTISGISESVNRKLVSSINISDTINGISDSISRRLSSLLSVIDNVFSVSETLSRTVNFSRTVVDNLPGITEIVNFYRTLNLIVTDTISSITDTVIRHPMVFIRNTVDSISSIFETLQLSIVSLISAIYNFFVFPLFKTIVFYIIGDNLAPFYLFDSSLVIWQTINSNSLVSFIPFTSSLDLFYEIGE